MTDADRHATTDTPRPLLYLVRHGQAAATWQEADDPGLSTLGRLQAHEAAQSLVGKLVPGTRLISSPMLRARQTSLPLAESLGTPVTIVDAFREIPTPVPRAQRQAWLYQVARQGWLEQHQIVRDWRQSLLEQLHDIRQPTVVFTHFMVLNAIISMLSQQDQVVCFRPDNASITTLRLVGDRLELVELGRQLETVVN